MKKILFWILPLLASLAACAPGAGSSSTTSSTTASSTTSSSTSSSSTTSTVPVLPKFSDVLENLKKGYKMEAEVQQIMGKKTTRYLTETQAIQDKITFHVFSSVSEEEVPTKDKEVLFETYIKDPDTGRVLATRLDISNKVNKYLYYNPATSEPYLFDTDGYQNFFMNLDTQDFAEEDQSYSLVSSDVALKNAIGTQLYGNPGFNLDSLTLQVQDDGSLSFQSTLTFKGASTSYQYDFDGLFVPLSDGEEILDCAKPKDPVKDDAFDTAFQNLRKNNYSLTVQNYEGQELLDTSTYQTTENGIRYVSNDGADTYDMYYYTTADGLVQECQKQGDFYVRLGEPMEGSLDELRPSLGVDRACLSFEDGLYSRLPDVEGDMSNFTILNAEASELSDFTIAINKENIVISNSFGDSKTVLTFTDIGSTILGVTPDDVKDPETGVSLVTLLDNATKDFLLTFMSEEDLNALPAPEGYDQEAWVNWTEGEPYAMLVYSGKTAVTSEAIESYCLCLEELGYSPFEESLNGGNAYTKATTVDGHSKTIYAEILDYDGSFTIVLMDVDNFDQI